MSKSRTMFGAALASALAFAAPVAAPSALAQEWHGGHGGAGLMGIMRQLNLTDAQREQVHALMQASRTATETTRTQLHQVSQQIETDMFSTATVTAAELAPLMQQQEQLRATLDQARISTMISMRGILTASQLATASSLHAQLATLHAREHALMTPPAASE